MKATALEEEISLGSCLSWCSTASRPPWNRSSAKCKKTTGGDNRQLLGRSAVVFLLSSSERKLPLSSGFPTRRSDTSFTAWENFNLLSQFERRLDFVNVVPTSWIFFIYFVFRWGGLTAHSNSHFVTFSEGSKLLHGTSLLVAVHWGKWTNEMGTHPPPPH